MSDCRSIILAVQTGAWIIDWLPAPALVKHASVEFYNVTSIRIRNRNFIYMKQGCSEPGEVAEKKTPPKRGSRV
jgi:hypothetical protein